MGPAYTLIRFDQAVDVTPLVEVAARQGVPLTLVDADRAKAGYGFVESLLLVRPDSHIAWRGMVAPHEPYKLFDRLRGIATQPEAMRRDDAVVA